MAKDSMDLKKKAEDMFSKMNLGDLGNMMKGLEGGID